MAFLLIVAGFYYLGFSKEIPSFDLPANLLQYSAEYWSEKIEKIPVTSSSMSVYSNVLEKVRVENKMGQDASQDFVSVTRVIDGDTIVVSIDGIEEKVRLIGADTPEVADPRKPVQCFGRESSDFAGSILSGKLVQLEADKTQGDRDKYGRLLRYVFLEDGNNFNKMLIEDGYAHEYIYHLPYKYQKEFKQAQKEAEAGKRGLWADGVCVKN